MSSQQQLLRQYISSLEIENTSKLTEINFLAEELNRVSTENQALNEELNFISCNVNRAGELEDRVMYLENVVRDREYEIRVLVEEREYEREEWRREMEEKRMKYTVEEIRELPMEEDIKTERVSEDVVRTLELQEAALKQNSQMINSLNIKLMQKQQFVIQLLKQQSDRLKTMESYLSEKHDFEQKLGEINIQYSILKLTHQNLEDTSNKLQQSNAKLAMLNHQLTTQNQSLKKDIQVLKTKYTALSSKDANTQVFDLQTTISELKVKIMLLQMKEQESDKQVMDLTNKLNRVTKQLNLLKNERNSISQLDERDNDFEEEGEIQIQKLRLELSEVLEMNNALLKEFNIKGDFSPIKGSESTIVSPIKTPTKTVNFCGISSPKSDIANVLSTFKKGSSTNIPSTYSNLKQSINQLRDQSIVIRQYLNAIPI